LKLKKQSPFILVFIICHGNVVQHCCKADAARILVMATLVVSQTLKQLTKI